MSDLISRSALIEALTDVEVAWYMDGNYTTYDSTTIVDIIGDQPSVEPVRGEWIYNGIPESVLRKCSVCGCLYGSDGFNFCPNCGADMRKKV